ncbi:MAG: hypothetical protein HY862_06955 [Chloroflexi bacterium]|nr:hypothetical protein [Chloroflexota bacterium]
MFKIRGILLFSLMCLGVFATPTSVSSIDDELLWFWATTPDGLVGYSLDGQVNLLLDDPALATGNFEAWRLSSSTALISEHQRQKMYLVDTKAMYLLDNGSYESFDRLEPQIYKHPYLVLFINAGYSSAFVVDVDQKTVSPLSGQIRFPESKPVILSDGKTLRYFSYLVSASDPQAKDALLERNLQTNEEILLIAQNTFDVFRSWDGEQWWIGGQFNGDTQMLNEVFTIGAVNPEITELIRKKIAVVRDKWAITFDPQCTSDCEFNILSLTGQNLYHFTLERAGAQPPFVRAELSNNRLLVLVDEYQNGTLYVLNSSGEVTELGFLPYGGIDGAFHSSNGRWVITSTEPIDPTNYQLWDLEQMEIVGNYAADHYISTYFASEFVLTYSDYSIARLYDARTGQEIDLSHYSGRFFQLLDSGQMLYEILPDSDLPAGIYLVDVFSNTTTLLVPMGQAIHMEEIR